MELITVGSTKVGKQKQQTVNARELHTWLGSGQHFANWIRGRIDQYEFEQDVDYIAINSSITSPPTVEYHITLDMAKELSMVERSYKGREARKYFITCEVKLKEERAQRVLEYQDRLAKLEAIPNLMEARRLMETKAERDYRDTEKLNEKSEKLRKEYGNHYTRIMDKIEKLVERVNKRTNCKHTELSQVLSAIDDHARFDDGDVRAR